MIKHIVIWNLMAEDASQKQRDALEVKQRLEALAGKVPSLRHIEVGLDFNQSDAAMDVLLLTEFDDRAGLDAYQVHPDHQAVIPFIKSVCMDRRVVDYEI